VEKTLKELPKKHTSDRLIERVSFSNEYVIGNSGNPIQAQAHFPLVAKAKATIEINRQKPEGMVDANALKTAITHEIGHVVYRFILTGEQKVVWQDTEDEIYEVDDEEEFARSYSSYTHEDHQWEDNFPEEYYFFKELGF